MHLLFNEVLTFGCLNQWPSKLFCTTVEHDCEIYQRFLLPSLSRKKYFNQSSMNRVPPAMLSHTCMTRNLVRTTTGLKFVLSNLTIASCCLWLETLRRKYCSHCSSSKARFAIEKWKLLIQHFMRKCKTRI